MKEKNFKKIFQIGHSTISENGRVFIIAEA